MRKLAHSSPHDTPPHDMSALTLYRDVRRAHRAALHSEADALLARILPAIDADIHERQRLGLPLGIPFEDLGAASPDAQDPRPLHPATSPAWNDTGNTTGHNMWHNSWRTQWRTTARAASRWTSRAAGVLLFAVGLGHTILQSHYAELRAQEVPPASVTFVDAPLSVVMADLRRRYGIDVKACDPGYRHDRVTLTLRDAPIDSVIKQIADQTLRWANWHNATTVRLTPQADYSRGWRYNLVLFLRGISSTAGCWR